MFCYDGPQKTEIKTRVQMLDQSKGTDARPRLAMREENQDQRFKLLVAFTFETHWHGWTRKTRIFNKRN